MRLDISYKISIPTVEHAISAKSFKVMIEDVLLRAKSDQDRKNFLWLICMDCFFTTKQAQNLINTLREKNLIEPGAITIVDVVHL